MIVSGSMYVALYIKEKESAAALGMERPAHIVAPVITWHMYLKTHASTQPRERENA